MIKSNKNWKIHRPDEAVVESLMTELKLPSLHAKILASRGFQNSEAVKKFLTTDASVLHDPFLLYDMDKAIARIQAAIENGEHIVVYGDYDADGVTSVSVLTTALERKGADVSFVIPNRFEHGYGPNSELFQEIADLGASLIITVDNGISGIEQTAFAKSIGLDIIITDHHEIGESLPEADAVIHPRHPEGNYPFGELAGVGVAFKLATALLGEAPLDLLEFAAIGTVADLVPLLDENRYFVKEGIRRLRMSSRPGIQALAKIGGTEQRQFTEETIGFMVGPRLNAPGRLGDADPAVDLLKAEDNSVATGIANELDRLNKERQALVNGITEEALTMIEENYGSAIPHVFVLAKEGWNPGVIGIVASRLTEKFHRPSIVLAIDPVAETAKGSARSIEGFDLYQELSKNKELLPHFGGHAMAAGMTLALGDVDTLRERLNAQAAQVLTDDQLIATIQIDVPLTIDEIEVDVLESLEQLRPFGMAFPKPMYMIEQITVGSIRKIGSAKNHLKLELEDGSSKLDAISFGSGELADEMTHGMSLMVTGDLQVNEWNNFKKPQILLQDIRSDERQVFDLRGIRDPLRWIHTIPKENTLYIAFQPQTKTHFLPILQGKEITMYEERQVNGTIEHIVLLDMPEQQEQLESLLSEYDPGRIYAHFYAPDSRYFDGIPNRKDFGWYFSFLKKRETFNLTAQAEQLAKHKGWKLDTIYFMSKVFFDLGFVKIENGVVYVEPTAGKRDLAEAPAYHERKSQIEMEERMLYAPYHELKQWFQKVHQEIVIKEETVWT
ncbi:single-stranded-DNA-specific exonuclease RecJ [Sporosarcina sp. BI001-red]|uniref:single-stranded-DNA-specific exonuclease RecJ n=1 Tax=Sporosarcina sp. BI001-red TaxID=2282866 RepID=UPI000E21E217|nr:single-stranded-DNA-specific exonuclease RecJ [Sporosarcina sp. BI001-red]REB07202.1 single-stranded-DNA-specific exonuclease RecJ [Sporosarcina sp. BI001-red]